MVKIILPFIVLLPSILLLLASNKYFSLVWLFLFFLLFSIVLFIVLKEGDLYFYFNIYDLSFNVSYPFIQNLLIDLEKFTKIEILDSYYLKHFELNPINSVEQTIFGYIDMLSISHIWLTSLLCIVCVLLTFERRGALANFSELELTLLRFFIILLMFILIIIFTTINFFWFFVWFEISLLPTMLVIGFWGSRSRSIMASYRFFIYTLVGSVCLFFALLYIWYLIGTFSLEDMTYKSFTREQQIILWLLLFLTFAVKVPIFPFHVWLPEAHAEAPTIGSIILAGILLKLGPYGLLRFANPVFFEGFVYWRPLVMMFCVVGLFYTSFIAICNVDLKKIIAYSSIGHMAFVILGICSDTLEGVVGGIIMMLSHGFVSSGLFLCIGLAYDRMGTRMLPYYGGLGQLSPNLTHFFLIFIISNIGFPGTFSYVSEFLILFAVYKMNTFVFGLTLLASVFILAYNIWLFTRVFGGLPRKGFTNLENFGKPQDIVWREQRAIIVLLLPVLLFGLDSSILVDGLEYYFYNYKISLGLTKFI